MTINDFLQTLADKPTNAPVVFTTEQGEISGGYHVTELKLANITGIDCAARQTEWAEASVQLLDGGGGAHMEVGKLSNILGQSKRQVKGLGEADMHFEFAHNNAGLQRYTMQSAADVNGRIVIHLDTQRAVCKPAQDCVPADDSGCCGSSPSQCGC